MTNAAPASDAPVRLIAVPTASAPHPFGRVPLILAVACAITAGGYAWHCRQSSGNHAVILADQLAAAEQRADAAQALAVGNAARMQAAEKDADEAMSRNTRTQAQCDQLRGELDHANQERRRLEETLTQYDHDLQTSTRETAQARTELAAAQERISALVKAGDADRQACVIAEKTISSLREERTNGLVAQQQAQLDAQDRALRELQNRLDQQQRPAQPPVIIINPVMPPRAMLIAHSEPPPPRQEPLPARPDQDAVWIGGFWTWDGSHWTWIHGSWSHPPHPHARWIDARWDRTRDDGWCLTPGYWRQG